MGYSMSSTTRTTRLFTALSTAIYAAVATAAIATTITATSFAAASFAAASFSAASPSAPTFANVVVCT